MARSLEQAHSDSSNNNNTVERENNRNTAIAEISRLMLEGWTLLGEICPLANCNTPLVRNRNTGVTMCCSCRAQVVRSINHLESANSYQENNTPAPVQSSSPVAETEQEQAFSLAEADSIGEFQRDSDRVSKQIGEKLLQGWALLDINCPNPQCACPLMRDHERALFCVSCQRFYEESSQREMQVDNRSGAEMTDLESVENKRPRTMSSGTNSLDTVNRGDNILRATEATLLGKIDQLQVHLSQSENMQEWFRINEQLSYFLSNLQKIRCLLDVNSSSQLS